MDWTRRPDEPPFSRGYRPGPVRRPAPTTRSAMNPLAAAALVLGLLALMWLLEFYDQANHNVLDEYGIHARQIDGLPEIFTAPLLHAGFPHLIGNSLPFAVL